MLSNSRFFIRTLLIVLSFTASWIVLTASAAIEGLDHQKLNSNANRAEGLAAWEQRQTIRSKGMTAIAISPTSSAVVTTARACPRCIV